MLLHTLIIKKSHTHTHTHGKHTQHPHACKAASRNGKASKCRTVETGRASDQRETRQTSHLFRYNNSIENQQLLLSTRLDVLFTALIAKQTVKQNIVPLSLAISLKNKFSNKISLPFLLPNSDLLRSTRRRRPRVSSILISPLGQKRKT